MKLEGKVALITGSATGIGREIALSYAREGASICVNYSVSELEAQQTAADIEKLGVCTCIQKADISQDTEVRRMVEVIKIRLGRIDILVNNAATTYFVPADDLEALSEQMWDRILAVNVKGTFFCSRAVVPIMKAQGSGTIINIASIAGIIGTGSSIAYTVSKAGVISLTKAFAKTFAPEIRVNAIAPGVVYTRWTEKWPEFLKTNEEATPMKRIAHPKDIAEVALALTTDAGFITGQTIVVDGGKSL